MNQQRSSYNAFDLDGEGLVDSSPNRSSMVDVVDKDDQEFSQSATYGNKGSLGTFFGFPVPVFFIFGNEFCERFSFYGFKAVLWLYIHEYLLFSADASTSIYHAFVFLTYGCSILGGVISDSYLGRYKTILYLSLLYCLGNLTLAITAVPGVTGDPPHWWGMMLGLLFISLGSGGIKPCVSSFGGDQIPPNQPQLLASFFSIFYLSINVGSLISTFLTPELRKTVGYWLAFGVPAVLLMAALVIFYSGRAYYKMIPPGDNVLLTFLKVMKSGVTDLVANYHVPTPPGGHWLDRLKPLYGTQIIEDIKGLLRITMVFFPLPVFWALFDQSGSRWVEQASEMNPYVGSWKVLPDQVQTLNPLFVMILIPLFDMYLYPAIRKLGFKFLPLQRMTIGMFIAALSYVIAGLLQISNIEDRSVAWQSLQYLVLTIAEVLVSPSGLEFSYSQAPASMKSVIMAIWLTTVAFGNIIVVFVAEVSLFSLAFEFFFYAILMALFAIGFLYLTKGYTYVEIETREAEAQQTLLSQDDQ